MDIDTDIVNDASKELSNERLISKPSKFWKYFGHMKINGKIIDDSAIFCIPCYKGNNIIKPKLRRVSDNDLAIF